MMRFNFVKFNKLLFLSGILWSTLWFASCESEYNKTVNREAEKGIAKDSLVLGMSFGDTRQSFYDQCWQLNNKGLVTQGPNNRSVQYLLSSNDADKNLTAINMLFYGSFNEYDFMTGMDMEFSYKAWSPWNDDMSSKKLLPVIKDTLMNWFPGNDFIPIKSDKVKLETHVKVDGNRQILVYAKDIKDVVVKIENLKIKYPEKFK
ncbi:MAG: hypothetical protein WBM98_06170 [Maribacter sp.]|uniref:hypothetical protein n=1 Tax=Maribacter sp. TaxID=1897614 RepID=UPI003C713B74